MQSRSCRASSKPAVADLRNAFMPAGAPAFPRTEGKQPDREMWPRAIEDILERRPALIVGVPWSYARRQKLVSEEQYQRLLELVEKEYQTVWLDKQGLGAQRPALNRRGLQVHHPPAFVALTKIFGLSHPRSLPVIPVRSRSAISRKSGPSGPISRPLCSIVSIRKSNYRSPRYLRKLPRRRSPHSFGRART